MGQAALAIQAGSAAYGLYNQYKNRNQKPKGPSNGNLAGGGNATSQAATQGFNNFLNQYMQSGGMNKLMGQGQQPPQWNPYMSLVNPQGGSYKPQMPGQPQGYPSMPQMPPQQGGGMPQRPQTGPWWNPTGGAPQTRPGSIPQLGGGGNTGGFAGGPGAPPMMMNMQQSFDPNQSDQMRAQAAGAPDWQQYSNQVNTNPIPQGMEKYTGGPMNSVQMPAGGFGAPVGDPMINPESQFGLEGNGPPIQEMGGGQEVNQYGMPTGGFGGLQNVPGQYNGSQFNPFGGQMPGMVDGSYGGFQGQQPGMIGPQNGMFNDPAFMPQLQMGLGGQANLNPAGFGTQAQLGDAGSADVYGKFATDTQNLLGRKADRDVADLRARYGMGGGSNLGSAAALAEGNFRAENNAQVGVALGNINNQERGLNLQSRGQDLQNYLGSRGLDVQGRGQDLQNYLGSRGLDINQLGMMTQNNQFGADLGLRGAMANQNSQMNWQQLMQGDKQFGANLGFQGQVANQGAQQNWQQLMSQNNQFMNQFNQNDSQFGATFGQNAANMNNQTGLQNQQQMNQYGIGVAGLGQNQQQMEQQQQQFMFSQMMQAYMKQAGWNTPQAENVVKPSGLSQWAGAAGTALDLWNKYSTAKRGA